MFVVIVCDGFASMVQVDMESVLGLMDRYMRGERNLSLPTFQASVGPSASAESEDGDTKAQLAAARAFAMQQRQESKLRMQDEVKRISNNYNEEKQKLDLAMKIEQARQRQALQRKLLLKKQKQQGTVANNIGTLSPMRSTGYPGDAAVDAITDVGASFRIPHGVMSRGLSFGPMLRK